MISLLKAEMNMQPRIVTAFERKLIGKKILTSLDDNQTMKLWQSFMPSRKEIKNNLNSDLFSLQVYPESFDFTFSNKLAVFEKWAAVEVPNFEIVPYELETFKLLGGLFAVFNYKGLSTDTTIFEYIYGSWLPNSKNYLLDITRPHFEILGSKYRNNDPNSEEEIWIPIKSK